MFKNENIPINVKSLVPIPTIDIGIIVINMLTVTHIER